MARPRDMRLGVPCTCSRTWRSVGAQPDLLAVRRGGCCRTHTAPETEPPLPAPCMHILGQGSTPGSHQLCPRETSYLVSPLLASPTSPSQGTRNGRHCHTTPVPASSSPLLRVLFRLVNSLAMGPGEVSLRSGHLPPDPPDRSSVSKIVVLHSGGNTVSAKLLRIH